MAVTNPPSYLQGGSHPAKGLRRMTEALTGGTEGALASGELAVSEKSGTPDMSVDVAAGRAYVLGTESAFQGTYFVESRSVENLTISAADATNPRKDIVVAKVEDSEESGATDAWSLAVVTGTPAASPSAPSQPANSLLLATVDVAALASSITDSDITQSTPVWPGTTVDTAQLVDGAVEEAKLGTGAVSEAKLAADSVTSAKIAAGAVGASEIAAGAVGSSEIAAGAVGSSELATDSVTADAIASGAVGSSEIAAGAVDTSELAADAVTAAKIASGAVGSSEIAAGAVDTSELAADAVTNAKIAADAVTGTEVASSSNLSVATVNVDQTSAANPGVQVGDTDSGLYSTGGGTFFASCNSTAVTKWAAAAFSPASDNAIALGASGARWTAVYAVNGTIQTSDERLKVRTGEALGLDFVSKLEPFAGHWVGDESEIVRQFLSAQQVEAAAGGPGSGIVSYDADADLYSMNYSEMVPVLVRAIQELKEEIAELKG